jgi:hypothetical protein
MWELMPVFQEMGWNTWSLPSSQYGHIDQVPCLPFSTISFLFDFWGKRLNLIYCNPLELGLWPRTAIKLWPEEILTQVVPEAHQLNRVFQLDLSPRDCCFRIVKKWGYNNEYKLLGTHGLHL